MKVCRKPPRRALAKIASAAFALRRAPAVADAASAATARRAGKLLRVFAQHLLDGPDPSRQAEALK